MVNGGVIYNNFTRKHMRQQKFGKAERHRRFADALQSCKHHRVRDFAGLNDIKKLFLCGVSEFRICEASNQANITRIQVTQK